MPIIIPGYDPVVISSVYQRQSHDFNEFNELLLVSKVRLPLADQVVSKVVSEAKNYRAKQRCDLRFDGLEPYVVSQIADSNSFMLQTLAGSYMPCLEPGTTFLNLNNNLLHEQALDQITARSTAHNQVLSVVYRSVAEMAGTFQWGIYVATNEGHLDTNKAQLFVDNRVRDSDYMWILAEQGCEDYYDEALETLSSLLLHSPAHSELTVFDASPNLREVAQDTLDELIKSEMTLLEVYETAANATLEQNPEIDPFLN